MNLLQRPLSPAPPRLTVSAHSPPEGSAGGRVDTMRTMTTYLQGRLVPTNTKRRDSNHSPAWMRDGIVRVRACVFGGGGLH